MTDTNSGSATFRINDGFGLLITNLALDDLLFKYSPDKAFTLIKDTLMGCPDDLVYKLLNGELVLIADAEAQECYVTEPNDIHFNVLNYPRIDHMKWVEDKIVTLNNASDEMQDIIDILLRIINNSDININIKTSTVIDYLLNNDDVIINEILNEDDTVMRIELIIRTVKSFIETTNKILLTIDWLFKSYPNNFNELIKESYVDAIVQYNKILRKFDEIIKGNYSTNVPEMYDTDLNVYLKAILINDQILSKGIEPVDIMDGYDAGWLSPEGLYYGLNGSVANMLHLNIADALYNAGIIEESEENKANPDQWLERMGWVKIHGNYIDFAGGHNKNLNKGENTSITDNQIILIKNYINKHHFGLMQLGWKKIKVSSGRFETMMKNNPNRTIKEYFDF